MKTLVLEARLLKRCSKKVKTEYFLLAPGEHWSSTFEGQRIWIINEKENTSNLYVGRK
jgi:hypothetical protein